MKVLKFGGTSMASSASFLQVKDIIGRNDNCCAVVSAPGARYPGDRKVTDLMYDCYDAYLATGRCDVPLRKVSRRFEELTEELGLKSLRPLLTDIKYEINGGRSVGYAAGRGEYLAAKLTADATGLEFIDAAEIIKFGPDGLLDMDSSIKHIQKRLAGSTGCVVPGFYGVMPNGVIKTFARGGSDITGSIVARAVGAEVYENWTDVDGFYFSDPKTSDCDRVLPRVSRRELKLLSLMGAGVLHHDSLTPLAGTDIPIVIKNTFYPEAPGSVITGAGGEGIAGVALRRDLCRVRISPPVARAAAQQTIRDYGGFALELPSLLETDILASGVGEECERALKKLASETYGRQDVAVITVVGEGLTARMREVITAVSGIVEQPEFLLYDGDSALYVGIEPRKALGLFASVSRLISQL